MAAPSAVIFLCAAVAAGLAALVTTPLVRRLAIRLGVLDQPGGRRVHAVGTPTLGGPVLILSFAVGWTFFAVVGTDPAAFLAAHGWNVPALLGGAFIILAVGVLDDVRDVSARFKLLGELGAAAVAVAGGYGFSAITNPFTGGYWELGWFGTVVSLAWIIGITNAFNLIDGLDGLAAGVALIASITICVVAVFEGRPDAALLAVLLLGTLAGFLRYNFPPASIFLGDSGALLLGYLLSLISIQGLQKGTTAIVTLVPLLALGLPIMDMLVTVWRRFLVAGVSAVFHADQEHIHHRLVSMGLTHRRAVLTLYGVCILFSALAFLSLLVRGPGNAILVGLVAVASYAGIRRLGYRFSSNGTPRKSP